MIYFYENGDWATCSQSRDCKYWTIEEGTELYNKVMNSFDLLKPVVENDILIDVIENSKLIRENEIVNKIDDLKKRLTDGDYKVIKCYEAAMLGTTMPYNIEELVVERQSIRDEINKLESELSN